MAFWSVAKKVIESVAAVLDLSLLLYLFVPARARPQLITRVNGVDQNKPSISGTNGTIDFGISTRRSEPVSLTSVSVQPILTNPLRLKGSDPLKTVSTSSGVAFEWKGEERLSRGDFLLFSVPFESKVPPAKVTSILVAISTSAQVAPEKWGLPWSLFSEPIKKETFVRRFTWKLAPAAGEETGFKLGPMESVRIFGDAAKKSVEAHGIAGLKVKTIEIFEDGSYSTNWIEATPRPKPYP